MGIYIAGTSHSLFLTLHAPNPFEACSDSKLFRLIIHRHPHHHDLRIRMNEVEVLFPITLSASPNAFMSSPVSCKIDDAVFCSSFDDFEISACS